MGRRAVNLKPTLVRLPDDMRERIVSQGTGLAEYVRTAVARALENDDLLTDVTRAQVEARVGPEKLREFVRDAVKQALREYDQRSSKSGKA